MAETRTCCDCCGTCCQNGGPALHTEDYELVASGILSLDDLITVRRGEYVYHPLTDDPQPAASEFVKLRGKGTAWSCLFFDAALSRCTFYEHRPLACRLLRCWAPEDVLAISGRTLLSRFALMAENDPVAALVKEHEAACSVSLLYSLTEQLQGGGLHNEVIAELTDLVNLDCRFRRHAVSTYRLSLARELFYFGRPLFQLLIPLGIVFSTGPDGGTLQYEIT